MKAKGLDVSRMAAKAIHQVPNLDHYQVIVALDREVQKGFPQRPRKVVYLDWTLEDPSQKAGSPEAVGAAYEAAYQFLRSHIRDMVGAILGQKPS
jgi:protein-tyrosine-phosphatase